MYQENYYSITISLILHNNFSLISRRTFRNNSVTGGESGLLCDLLPIQFLRVVVFSSKNLVKAI